MLMHARVIGGGQPVRARGMHARVVLRARQPAVRATRLRLRPMAMREGFTAEKGTADVAPGSIQLAVRIAGKQTEQIFRQQIRQLSAEAPPVRGFRQAKGGKTVAQLPTPMLINMLGKTRVYAFVINELITEAVRDFVADEKIEVKEEFKVSEDSATLVAKFEPGKELQFGVTLTLEGTPEAAPAAEAPAVEVGSSAGVE